MCRLITWLAYEVHMKRSFIILILLLIIITPTRIFADLSDESFTIPLGKGMSLHMTVAQFSDKKHKITKCQILEWSGICLVDDKPVFGTDWDLPRNQLVKATFKIGTNKISLDVSCMYNPWFDKPNPKDFKVTKAEGGHVITGHFSDGAGSYEAEWLVIQNSSIRTHLAKVEC